MTAVIAEPYIGHLWEETADGGAITEWGETVYSEGDCWALAWYLYHEFNSRGINAELYFAGDSLKFWYHVFVKIGDNFFDVFGKQTSEKMKSSWRWGFHTVPESVYADWDSFYRQFGDWCFDAAPAHAELVAKKLVDGYEWD